MLGLFGPNEVTSLVAEDDDGGAGTNARISAMLDPGTYYAKVRHFNPAHTGEYRIRVSR
jgi:tyrosinase